MAERSAKTALLILLILTLSVNLSGFEAVVKNDVAKSDNLVILTMGKDENMDSANRIVVNIPSFELFICNGNKIIKTCKVSLGRIGLPTPEGNFIIDRKVKDPYYIPLEGSPNKKIADYFAPGENNPMGTRKMHIYGPIYIHGLPQNKRNFIGRTKNGSCVALLKEDIEGIFDFIKIGTKVDIYYKPNRITINNDLVNIEKYPDLYNGYRRKVTDNNVFPPEIKKIPVRFIEKDKVDLNAIKALKLEESLAQDTLVIIGSQNR
ncbi:MAG: L,D-transpeptidase [Elusimicrobia bacterium]|nr:L,D-transpeptidase [Elusimicrobiota bacterium]